MAQTTFRKYEHIGISSRTKKIILSRIHYSYRAELMYKLITTKDIITADDIHKLSYNNAGRALESICKKHNINLKQLNSYTWEIVK